MRQGHIAGEMLFVDSAGRTMEVIDGATSEISTVQIFGVAPDRWLLLTLRGWRPIDSGR